MVYWVQILLHWCDSNAVFIAGVSKVCANSPSEDGKKQNQSVHTRTAFLKIFSGTRKKG